MSHSYRFKSGELIEVAETPPYYHSGTCAPIMAGLIRRMRYTELKKGFQFLVLSDAVQATHLDNRKLYVEVMTQHGPAICWCSLFKMRKNP